MNNNLLHIWNLNSTWALLASIGPSDKISITGNDIIIQKNTFSTSVIRKIMGKNRNDVFSLIKVLIDFTCHHLENNNHIKYDVKSFKNNILNGIFGLLNLRNTYKNDIEFLSIFNSNIERITLLDRYFCIKDENYNNDEEFKLLKQNFLELKKIIMTNYTYSFINSPINKNNNIKQDINKIQDISNKLDNNLKG